MYPGNLAVTPSIRRHHEHEIRYIQNCTRNQTRYLFCHKCTDSFRPQWRILENWRWVSYRRKSLTASWTSTQMSDFLMIQGVVQDERLTNRVNRPRLSSVSSFSWNICTAAYHILCIPSYPILCIPSYPILSYPILCIPSYPMYPILSYPILCIPSYPIPSYPILCMHLIGLSYWTVCRDSFFSIIYCIICWIKYPDKRQNLKNKLWNRTDLKDL